MRSSIERFVAVQLFWVSAIAIQASYADTLSVEAPRAHSAQERRVPINVIFDTDIWSDIDDALALAMLNALHDRHEINLVAVTVSTGEKWCASYVDLVDTFYDHPHVPIGLVRDGLDTEAFRKKYPTITWPVTRHTQLGPVGAKLQFEAI
jgi:hypothetical protein